MKKKIIYIGISLVLIVAIVLSAYFLLGKFGLLGGEKAPDGTEKNDPPKSDIAIFTVTFDANGTNVNNLPNPQEVSAGEYITEPEAPTRQDYFFFGWHTSPDAVALVDAPITFDEYSVEQDTTLYAIWESMAIDIDGDGLSYEEETQYGTDAFAIDSDFDGLSDGEEVAIYNTNPLNADSDNDGIKDGVEIALKLNPLSAISDGITEDTNRQIEIQVQDDNKLFNLSICATPNMLSSISTETFNLNLLENSEGLISPIIDIEYDETKSFNYATMTFDYSGIDLMGVDENNLTFLYLNENTGVYEIVPSTVDKVSKTICFTPTHFSSYVVGDRAVVSRAFSFVASIEINYGSDTIKASEVVTTNFDVQQHGFAFHNFQYQEIGNGGFCYGFSLVTYLNYVQKLPLIGEEYSNLTLSHTGYDISEEDRFFANQLYIEEEENLFNQKNGYDLKYVDFTQVLKSITYWYGKQHNIRDQFFDNLGYSDNFAELKKKLANDEPVPLSLWRSGGGHSVLACGLYQSETDPNVYYISIYDSNYPGEMQYIKLTEGGSLFGTNALEYGNYTNFQMSNLTVPTEGPFVSHEFDVSGTIVNSSGAVNGVKVTIKNDKYTDFVYTDSTGTFKFINVPNGNYDVEVCAENHHKKELERLFVVYGKDIDVGNIELIPITVGNEDPPTSSDQLCLAYFEPILSEHYEGNEGDSRIFILEGEEYRNGNVGINGEHYQNGFEVWIARWNYTEEISWVRNIYYLGGKCTILSGKTGLIAGSYNSNDFNTTLYFYGDGTLLDSIILTNEDYQHEFEIDVSNVQELEIFVQDNIAVCGGTSFALYDLFLTGDFSNPIVPPSTSDEFSWEFDQTTGTVIISGTGELPDYHCDHNAAPWDELGYYDLLKHMVIKDGITEIGSFTFAFVDESVTIPKSVTKIRAGAFADAWNIQTIYYQGTEAEWNSIEIDYAGNSELDDVNIVYLGNNK